MQTIIRWQFDTSSGIPITKQLHDFLEVLIEEGHTIQNVVPTHYNNNFLYSATIITKITSFKQEGIL